MMEYEIQSKVRRLLLGTQILLTKAPKDKRNNLIRVIFYGDRVLAALRDGEDFSYYLANMEANLLQGV